MQTSRLRWSKTEYHDISATIGIIVFAIYGGILSLMEYYATDAIGYQFLIPEEVNEYSTVHVRSLADVWVSQTHHWHTVNGRFVCHFLAQIFCGLLPQWFWSVANGVVYGLLAWLCGYRTKRFGQSVWIGIMTFLVVLPRLAFSPPMQLNYIWGYALEISFIYLFLRKKVEMGKWRRIPVLAGWVMLAFCAGQWNEAFVIPVGVGLAALFIYRKGKFTSHEWTGAIAFASGALLLGLAPGNMVRLADTTKNGFNVVDYLRHALFSLYPIVVGFIISLILFGRNGLLRVIRNRSLRTVLVLLYGIVCGSYLLGLLLGFSSGNRVVAAVPLAVVLFLNLVGRNETPRHFGMAILIAAGLVAGCARLEKARETNARYEMYDVLYRESSDGRVYVPVSILETDWREDRFASFFITYQRKSEDPGAPAIKLLPEEARGLTEGLAKDSDFNAVIPLSKRSWLFVRSEKSPARFLLKRRIGIPNTPLTLPISDRELDFVSPSNDIAIDTLKHVRLGLYVNERPYVEATPYMIEE